MLADAREQQIAAALRAARLLPREGWEGRALAALADIRPRRHPNLLTFILVAALILLLAAGVFAAVRHLFHAEGTLFFVNNYAVSSEPRFISTARVLSGEVERQVDEVRHGVISHIWYATGEALFLEGDGWPDRQWGDIIKAKLDGSDPVNLTERAGLGGLNCGGRWSPDRSMIAFHHCEPAEDMRPCEVGFHVWVMNADGTDAHPVTPEGAPPTSDPRWSPEGRRLLVNINSLSTKYYWRAAIVDIRDMRIRPLPNGEASPVWSPDGSMIASAIYEERVVDGEPGVRRALLLTNADGSDPRILVEQFIATADAEASSRNAAQLDSDERHDSAGDVQWGAGPREPEWSPHSDKIAFLAALPFDASRLRHRCQTEVWVYDLRTDELIRVTNDDVEQNALHWQ